MGFYETAVLSDRPIAWWRLDETSGTVAADQIGSADGAYVGGVTLGQSGALVDGNTAVLLDGLGGQVTFDQSVLSIDGSGPFSVEAWVLTTSSVQPDQGVFSYDTGPDAGIELLINPETPPDATLRFVAELGSTQVIGPIVTPSVWTHFVVTYDGATLTIYADGVATNSAVASPLPAGQSLWLRLGNNNYQTDNHLSGKIDDISVYDYALAADQVSTHYTTGTVANIPPPDATTLDTADTDVSPTVISAIAYPNGLYSKAWFVWGPTIPYEFSTPAIAIVGDDPVNVSANVDTESGRFHFNVVVSNAAGLAFGDDKTFDVDTTFTEGILDSASAWVSTSADLKNYLTALGQMFEDSYQIVIAQGEVETDDYEAGWSSLLNVDEAQTKFLPYLGMFVGTEIPPGTDSETARKKIRDEQGFKRGTVAAIEAAATRNLTGNATAVVIERTAADGVTRDPYHLIVSYDPADCPSRVRMISDVEAVKPAGIQITYGVLFFNDWQHQAQTWAATVDTWNQL